MKQCLICGKEFEPKHNAQRFCSDAHYNNCPICHKQVVWNSMKPVKPCCAKCTTNKRIMTNTIRYGCANVMQIDSTKVKRKNSKKTEKHKLLPIKRVSNTSLENPNFKIDESSMSVFILTEGASKEFLKHYGFRYVHKFSNIHLSLGLVKDGILYQVIRFEKSQKTDNIVLVDFGTRFGYFNPKGYAKLIHYATEFRGVEQFESSIPRNIADDLTIQSLRIELISRGDYEVYWIVEGDKLKKLTSWDNIPEMLQKYDYVTTDYIDYYHSISESL